jgi:hypothetical protein
VGRRSGWEATEVERRVCGSVYLSHSLEEEREGGGGIKDNIIFEQQCSREAFIVHMLKELPVALSTACAPAASVFALLYQESK